MGSAASWECWDAGSIPGLAQWVKDPLLLQLQLQLRSRLRLGSDPWPGNSICHGAAKKKKKKNTIVTLDGENQMKTKQNISIHSNCIHIWFKEAWIPLMDHNRLFCLEINYWYLPTVLFPTEFCNFIHYKESFHDDCGEKNKNDF